MRRPTRLPRAGLADGTGVRGGERERVRSVRVAPCDGASEAAEAEAVVACRGGACVCLSPERPDDVQWHDPVSERMLDDPALRRAMAAPSAHDHRRDRQHAQSH